MSLFHPSMQVDDRTREAKAKWLDTEDRRNTSGKLAYNNRLSRFADACKEKLAPKLREVIPPSQHTEVFGKRSFMMLGDRMPRLILRDRICYLLRRYKEGRRVDLGDVWRAFFPLFPLF